MWKICSLFKSRAQAVVVSNRLVNANDKGQEASAGERPDEGPCGHGGGRRTADEEYEDFFRCKRDSYSDYYRTSARWFFEPFLTAALATTGFHLTANPPCSRKRYGPYVKNTWLTRLQIHAVGLIYPNASFNVVPRRTILSIAAAAAPASSNEIAVQTDSQTAVSCVDDREDDLSHASRRLIGSFENALGLDLMRNGLRAEAFEHFRNASRMSDAKGHYNLGMCYYKGYGTRPNGGKAVSAWQQSAEMGNSLAKYQLGVGHLRGFAGLTVDENLALKYIFAAADENVTEAQNFAGAYHLKLGQLEKSKEFFERAAAAGDKTANSLLIKYFNKPAAQTKKTATSRAKFWTGNDDDDDDDGDGSLTCGDSSDDDVAPTRNFVRNKNWLVDDEMTNDSDVIFEESKENLNPIGDDVDQSKRFLSPLMTKLGRNMEIYPVKKSHSIHDFRK